MKRMLIGVTVFLLLATNAFALQMVAGTLVMQVPIGGTNSTRFGLIDDGNETITVSLRAEGGAAKYLSFPATVDLVPHKTVYTDITASIPADYDTSLGRNITGNLYALQEGKPGQVKINVQMRKSVNIVVLGESSQPSQVPTSVQNSLLAVSPLTGFVALVSDNPVVTVLAVALIAALLVIMFLLFKNSGKLKNSRVKPKKIRGEKE